jgi:hypothetical protein
MLFILLSILIYILIPLLCIFRLVKNRYNNFWLWLTESSLYFTYMLYLFFVAPWAMTYGKRSLFVLTVLFLSAYIYAIIRLRRPLDFRISTKKSYLKLGLNLFVLLTFSFQFYYVYQGWQKPSECVTLDFPFKKGSFEIIHGGSHQILNHHYPIKAQRYALDIVKINDWGLRGRSYFPKKLKDFNIFETEIHSPCDGTIIEAIDNIQDQTPGTMDPENLAGNFIALYNEHNNIIIVLAHLRKNSLQVRKGDRVSAGQYIAKVGNTGNTSEPHLHMHAVKNSTQKKDLFTKAKGIPILFKNRFLVRNMSIHL